VALIAVLVVLTAAVVVAKSMTTNYYVLTPGVAQPVTPLISVPKHLDRPIHGRLLLTDVYLTGPVNRLQYLWDKLTGDAQFVAKTTLLGPYTPPAQLTDQGYLEMAQSQAAAKVTALTRLGYHVGSKEAGVILTSVAAGTPAAAKLDVAQIVTAVDGKATPNYCAFVGALRAYGPGDTVRLSVEESTVTPTATIRGGRTVVVAIRMAPRPASAGTKVTGCPGFTTASRGYLGVSGTTQVDYSFPIDVSVRTTAIGGPSAGLAMTLGILEKLSSGDLTGGRTVAATGTITPTGSVGPVGGVAQKTVAVERAGATVFFVPRSNYATAESKDIPSLHVYPVTTLDQVLSILRRLGGHVPPAPKRAGGKSG
jgi:PDZ domain-containing protein